MNYNLIFLLGFMGAGKTTIGRRLSRKLDFKFIDTDQLIEDKFNMSVYDFFQEYGEDKFREEEKSIVQSIIKNNKKAVVSLGGGLPCYGNNMKLLNENGITCYLHRPVNELLNRLSKSKKRRPLLDNLSEKELSNYIIKKLEEREPYYLQARIIFDRDSQEVDNMNEKINLLIANSQLQ